MKWDLNKEEWGISEITSSLIVGSANFQNLV